MSNQSGRKSKTSYKPKINRNVDNNSSISVKDEIILLVFLLFSTLIFLSNIGVGGKATDFFADILFGVFGFSAYIFPFILVATVFMIVSSSRIRNVKSKITSMILAIIVLSTFSQLLDSQKSSNYDLWHLFVYAKRTHQGGGFIGGLLYKGLHPTIGNPGIIILCLFCIIIIGVLLTGKSFLSLVSSKGSKIVSDTRQDINKRRTSNRNNDNQNNTSFTIPTLANQDNLADNKKTKERHAKSIFVNLGKSEIPEEGVLKVEESLDKEIPILEKTVRSRRKKSQSTLKKEEFNELTGSSYVIDKNEEIIKDEKLEDIVPEVESSVNCDDTFKLPPINMFKKNTKSGNTVSKAHLEETANTLQSTLKSFGVNVNITDVSCGPAVTRYEFRPEAGVKVSRIISLADDIKLNLAVNDIRIEAPVPGKAAVGIEVPNETKSPVLLRDLLESDVMIKSHSKLSFAAGKDISGKVIVADLAKMPHMLVSGTTGSGKSVFTNSILMTYLYRCKPSEVRFIIIDPKVVEFGVYNGIPNLIIPVVTDPKKAAGALNWAVSEMADRYKKFADFQVRDLDSYNNAIDEKQYEMSMENEEDVPKRLPKIVIIIDELADLMMVAAKEVEESICRLAQLARAAGIHMIIATQRPSVDVITGLIKANIPSRVALTVASGTDSRTILEMNGAEKLLGRGDMLFYPSDYPKPLRVQGAFVSDKEISDVVNFLKCQSNDSKYDEEVIKIINSNAEQETAMSTANDTDGRDELFEDAGRLICDKQKASIGSLQRCFKIGFNRAARIMDQLCEAKVVGEEQSTKPREVLMTLEEFNLMCNGIAKED